MQLVKCKNGHVYDADKLKNCPHCQGIVKNLDRQADSYGEGQADVPTEVSEKKGTGENGMVDLRRNVGLLVQIEGEYAGRSFILYEGLNRIGRAGNLEISLPGEDTVSRNGHAEILYENGYFEIAPVKEDRIVLVNGKQVRAPMELNDRDLVGIGACVFSFVKYDDVYAEK